MAIKHLHKSKESHQICKCGKDSMIHVTEYTDPQTCIHLYMCNDCWWKYQGIQRPMAPWQIKQKQKDVAAWKKVMGYT